MSLSEVIDRLDFRQPGQRLVASAACIGMGALGTYLGAAATPAGLLADAAREVSD